MEDIKALVEREIEEYRQKHGERALLGYFNNFRFNLPQNYEGEDGYYRWRDRFIGVFDKKHKDEYPDEIGNYSELFFNQTPREFYRAVDEALEDNGISIEEVKKLQEIMCTDSAVFLEHINALYTLTLPAYIRLRESGYWRYKDLTA